MTKKYLSQGETTEFFISEDGIKICYKLSVRYLMTTKKIINSSINCCEQTNIPLLIIRGEKDEFVDKTKNN